MCIVLIGYQTSKDYPLIVASNRDEHFERPTAAAHFWYDYDYLYAGRDLVGKGTWQGVTKTGRFASLTNLPLRVFSDERILSRGVLVKEFLVSDMSAANYCSQLEGGLYGGCNLVVYDGNELVLWSNYDSKSVVLEPGVHAISNSVLHEHSPRIENAVKCFSELKQPHSTNSLIDLIKPPKYGTRQSLEEYELDDSLFIMDDVYGTRASTAMVISSDYIEVVEQQFGPLGAPLGCVNERISIQKS